MDVSTKILPSRDEMLRAFQASDASYDGVFVTGVRTTGIFCRPSCPARKPLSRNVEFFGSAQAAMVAGYRPCKRCGPLEPAGRRPEWVERVLTRIDKNPAGRFTASELREVGVAAGRARRWFMANYGITFAAYCRGRRLTAALTAIRDGAAIDDAVFDSGYESHSGFREAFARWFGVPPGRAAVVDPILVTRIESPLGPLIAGASERGICLLEFTDRRTLEGQLETIRSRFQRAFAPGENVHVIQLRAELAEYFAGRRKAFETPLEYPGTDFQMQVWRELLRIPYGQTRSYQDLAKAVQSPDAGRAVGRANGMNRIAILIPCHRVIGKDGTPVGYAGGLWRKRWLLDHERAISRKG
ncbi:MAG TPA: methylated-DNA--[protein]-cysteine S-methyltransferase [Terriglobia bacterium]|nr:methylated-DNA--[protein]-cysteine S-methyltransferase [Terriglobia bacterium]